MGVVAVCYAIGPVILQRFLAGVPALGVIAVALGLTAIVYLPTVRATVITYVNPAVAAVLGVVILGEHFTVGMGMGFVLVLAGSVLATRPSAETEPTHAPALEPARDPI